MKRYCLLMLIFLSSISCYSQTLFRSYIDPRDTVWANDPRAYVYKHGMGALISCSQYGSPGSGGIYSYTIITRINDNGDTLWNRRNPIDTSIERHRFYPPPAPYPVIDTIRFVGVIKSVAQLNNGNYLLGAIDINGSGCLVKQIDTLGNFVSLLPVLDSFPLQQTWQIKLLGIPNTDSFYLLYSGNIMLLGPGGTSYDSIKQTWHIVKMDGHYNVAWSRSYSTTYLSSGGAYLPPVDLNILAITAEGGLAFSYTHDTALAVMTSTSPQPKQFLRKLNAAGVMEWEVGMQYKFHSSANTAIMIAGLFCTHDSDVVLSLRFIDSTGTLASGYLLKVRYDGATLDTVFFPIPSMIGSLLPKIGVELSNGNFLYSSVAMPGFDVYDKHLNILYPMPFPFPENVTTWVPIANDVGGAFVSFQGGNYGPPLGWHVVAVNFDSSFQCYPAFVTGDLTKDINYDCVYNSGDEKRAGGVSLHEITSGTDYYAFSNDTGHYMANVPYGSYSVMHPTYGYVANECGGYSHTITAPVTLPGNDFYDTLIPGVRDLRVSLFSYSINPGVSSNVFASLHNNGTTSVDTTLFVTLDTRTTYINSVPAPTSIAGNTLIYDLHILPDSFALITVDILPATTLVFTDTVIFSAYSPFVNNIYPAADSVQLRTAVLSAYDPNVKLVNHLLYFDKPDDLVYTICFQNTGNDTARSVVVLDSLDTYVDPSTFRLLSSNHIMPAVTWLSGNRFLFSFKDIYLPDSNHSEPASHGCFSFSIKAKTSAISGDTIHNTAYIYFDYNRAIATNTTTNIISTPWPAGVHNSTTDDALQLYPNPTTGTATLVLPTPGNYSLQVSDITGRIVSVSEHKSRVMPIDISGHTPGIYILRITNQQTHEVYVRKLLLNK